MPSSPLPNCTARELRDVRVALRQGDAVIVRRLHPAVIRSVATAETALRNAPLVASKPSTSAWEKVEHFAKLSRDAVRLTAVTAGIAAAVFLSGEGLLPLHAAILTLLPAIVLLAKSGENSAIMQALRADARRTEKLRHSNEVRRRWLTTVDRATQLLFRSLSRPHALYETPSFGLQGRLTRRRAIDTETISRLQVSLTKARKVESVVAETSRPDDISPADVVAKGWSDATYFWRRILASGALAAFINCVLLAVAGRLLPSVIAGVACSTLICIRYLICVRETDRIEKAVHRDQLRQRYPDLLREIDVLIQEEVDYLIRLYASGLDIEIDPFEDLEPQLRMQLERALEIAERDGIEIGDVLDLHPLRHQFDAGSN